MLAKFREFVRLCWAVPPADRAYRVSLLVVLLLGLGLRLVGHIGEPIALWEDEAFWAQRLMKNSVLGMTIRPIGFMWVTQLLAETFGPTEFWLRFLPNTASAVTLLLSPYLASQLFASRLLRLLLLLLFALHPGIIDLAKEFKPYSVELMAHVALIALYLRYRQTRRARYMYFLLALLPVLFLFAYVSAVAYPGLLLLALWRGWVDKRKSYLIGALISGAVCLGVIVGTHCLILHRVTTARAEQRWGQKYDVFFVGKTRKGTQGNRVEWLSRKYADVASLPGLRRERWDPPASLRPWLAELREVDRLAWVLLHLLGVFYLVNRRRWEELLLLYLPLVTVVLLNILGRWPLGLFRVNLYLAAFTLPIPVFGVSLLAGARRWRRLLVTTLATMAYVVPTFAFGFAWHREKSTWTRSHHLPELLEVLRAERDRNPTKKGRPWRDRLILDNSTGRSYDYYLNIHPTSRERNRQYFRAHFMSEIEGGSVQRFKRRMRKRLKKTKRPIWIMLSNPGTMEQVRKYARSIGKIVLQRRLGKEHLVLRVAPK